MFVLAVLWYFTSYTLIILLWDVNGACYGFCSLVPVSMPEVYFWPAKTGKKFEFLKMHTCLCPSAQMFLGQKLLKLDRAFLSLHCLDRYRCFRCWNDFFLTVFHVLDWNFFLLLFAETFAIGSKICFDNKWIEFGVFFWNCGFFRWFWIWLDQDDQKCWNLCLVWHQVFSITSLRVIPVCCSNVLARF